MPDVGSLRKRLPLTLQTPEWSCCGEKGIRITEALGESQWALKAECLTCHRKLIINKHGMLIEIERKTMKLEGMEMNLTVTPHFNAAGEQIGFLECPQCGSRQECAVEKLADSQIRTALEGDPVCIHFREIYGSVMPKH